ncbi:DUF427 domain-containing protein [Shimia sp.]|uniref:DUF427 domain-containing protein n=1 Tax=Shimia sp. TaxID=1954381 RepID=UPI003297C767
MEGSRFGANSGYGLRIEPLDTTVRVWHHGRLLAQSNRAKVMYETRLPPQVYLPAEDVRVPLSDLTDLQTFCPFKGTARYRDIELDQTVIENAIWSYDDALPESREINGFIGFMPNDDIEIDLGGTELQTDDEGNISGPLVDWLMRGAAFLDSPEDFTKALSEKMLESGIAVSRMSVLIWSLHPMTAGKIYLWEKGQNEITTYAPTHDVYDHPSYVNSPLSHVAAGLGGVRQKLDGPSDQMQFSIMDELQQEGHTDYVAMPLMFSNGQINVMTLTSDHPKGFTTANLGLIFEISSVISRFFEVFMQKENAQSLLETYVGRRSGARVLGGDIRRGDGDEIDAAIMFCDLRGSTRLEEEMERDDYINFLNQFFDTVTDIVNENGGEVLKFIGDAVLAVFPKGEIQGEARSSALEAAKTIVRSLHEVSKETQLDFECSIGVAYGRVTYGNVGSRERLDFTVIGQPANIAARLGDFGKKIGRRIVVTQDVAEFGDTAEPLGDIALHNVSVPVTSYAVSANS